MKPFDERELQIVVHGCRDVIAASGGHTLDAEYFYASLPLCVIDAVYSIGVRYGGVQNVIARYCERFAVPRFAPSRDAPPERAQQESLSAFLARLEGLNDEQLADTIFENRQRTSSRGGILKAEAVRMFAQALARHRLEYMQDVLGSNALGQVERDVRKIPGQGSGISWSYFLMLAGRDDLVKPDRMILGFLGRVLGRAVDGDEAQALLAEAARRLEPDFPGLAPRTLDNLIWKQERARENRGADGGCRSG